MNIHKPIFDWTINLGHVLTFCGFIVTGILGFSVLDRLLALRHAGSLS